MTDTPGFKPFTIINNPHLLGLYGENIGPPVRGSRDRVASSHSVKKIYIFKRVSSLDYSTSVVTLHDRHKTNILSYPLANPSENQGEGTFRIFSTLYGIWIPVLYVLSWGFIGM